MLRPWSRSAGRTGGAVSGGPELVPPALWPWDCAVLLARLAVLPGGGGGANCGGGGGVKPGGVPTPLPPAALLKLGALAEC